MPLLLFILANFVPIEIRVRNNEFIRINTTREQYNRNIPVNTFAAHGIH